MSRWKALRLSIVWTVVVAVLLWPAPSGASPSGWESHGPPGGPVQALAIGAGAPDRVWAGTSYTTYSEPKPGSAAVSSNGAVTWREVAGLRLEPIGVFAIDPTNADIVYAGATCNDCDGIYKTTDGGRTWTLTLHRNWVETIAIDPADPQTLYTGLLIGGVYKSVDGGATWMSTSSGLAGKGVFALVVDPFDHQIVYAGTQTGGTFRSTDGGASWSPAREGLGAHKKTSALVADPTTPGRLFAGAADGVYRTLDGGDTWTSVSQGLDGHGVSSLTMASNDPQRMYAGSAKNGGWRTSDGGRHWTPLGAPLSSGAVSAVAVDPTRDDVVYAGTGSGVLKSFDAGRTWERRTDGLSNSDVQAFALGDGVLYAGEREQRGIYRSDDEGATWHQASGGLPKDAFIDALAVDPSDPDTAYAGQYIGATYKTADGGNHWFELTGAPVDVNVIRVAPSDALRIYAGGGDLLDGEHLYRSSDGGATWDDVTEPAMYGYSADLVVDPFDPDHLFAVVGDVFESIDAGESWDLVMAGSSLGGLAMDWFDPDLVYTGDNHGTVYRSTDGGSHWEATDTSACGLTYSVELATDPSIAGVVYMSTAHGACRGTGAGGSWSRLPNVATRTYEAHDLAVSPDGDALYVATTGSGVLRSTG